MTNHTIAAYKLFLASRWLRVHRHTILGMKCIDAGPIIQIEAKEGFTEEYIHGVQIVTRHVAR